MSLLSEEFLAGKCALVTGASRGLGRGIALALAEAGADVAVHYARRRTAAQEVVTQIENMGRHAMAVKANLAAPVPVDVMLNEVQNGFGRCDIFVANAATGGFRPTLETTDKYWDWTMDVNARSILHCVQRLAPAMIERGWGRVVAITSLGSTRAIPFYGAVGLSKAVVEALTRYLAVELAPHGITVNAVSPGLAETDAIASMPIDGPAAMEHFRQRSPARRLVTPQDIGRVTAFLCSDAAEMIVGQTIMVDGGYSLLSDFFPRLHATGEDQ